MRHLWPIFFMHRIGRAFGFLQDSRQPAASEPSHRLANLAIPLGLRGSPRVPAFFRRHPGMMRILCQVSRTGGLARNGCQIRPNCDGIENRTGLRMLAGVARQSERRQDRRRRAHPETPQPLGPMAQGAAAPRAGGNPPRFRMRDASYTWTNSSSNVPQMGHEAGGWPNSMCPQTGQR